MSNIRQTIVINRPVEEVFSFVTNLENDHEWWTPVTVCKKVTDGPIGVGTCFVQEATVAGVKVYNHIRFTEYQPNSLCVFVNEQSRLEYQASYRFRSLETGMTEFRMEADLHFRGLLALLRPIAYWHLQRETRQLFTKLQGVLERRSCSAEGLTAQAVNNI